MLLLLIHIPFEKQLFKISPDKIISLREDLEKIVQAYSGERQDSHEYLFAFPHSGRDDVTAAVNAGWECFSRISVESDDMGGFQVYLTTDLPSHPGFLYTLPQEDRFWLDPLLVDDTLGSVFNLESMNGSYCVGGRTDNAVLPGYVAFLQKHLDFSPLEQQLFPSRDNKPDFFYYTPGVDELMGALLQRENILNMTIDLSGADDLGALLCLDLPGIGYDEYIRDSREKSIWSGGIPLLPLLRKYERSNFRDLDLSSGLIIKQLALALKLIDRYCTSQGRIFSLSIDVTENPESSLAGRLLSLLCQDKGEAPLIILCVSEHPLSSVSEFDSRELLTTADSLHFSAELWKDHKVWREMNTRQRDTVRMLSSVSALHFYRYYRILFFYETGWIRKNLKESTLYRYILTCLSKDTVYCIYLLQITTRFCQKNILGMFLDSWNREHLDSHEKEIHDWFFHRSFPGAGNLLKEIEHAYQDEVEQWKEKLAGWLCQNFRKAGIRKWNSFLLFTLEYCPADLLQKSTELIWDSYLAVKNEVEIRGGLEAMEKLAFHASSGRKEILGRIYHFCCDRFLARCGQRDSIKDYFLQLQDNQPEEHNCFNDLHLLQKGKIYYGLGMTEQASLQFDALPDNFLRYGYHRQVGESRVEKALIEISAGNLRRAGEILEVAGHVSFQIDDTFNQCRSLTYHALVLFLSSYMKRAITKAEEALRLAESEGFTTWQLYNLFLLGKISFKLGKYATADTSFRQGEILALRYQNDRALIVFRNWGCRVLAHMKRPEAALNRLSSLPNTREKQFIQAEAMIMSRKWRDALGTLTLLKMNAPHDRDVFLSESPGWSDGFHLVEDRIQIAGSNTLEALIQGFYWFLQSHNNDPRGFDELRDISEKYPLSEILYLYYLVFPENRADEKQQLLVKILKSININVGQIVNPEFKKSFLYQNYWHARIMQSARKNGLI